MTTLSDQTLLNTMVTTPAGLQLRLMSYGAYGRGSLHGKRWECAVTHHQHRWRATYSVQNVGLFSLHRDTLEAAVDDATDAIAELAEPQPGATA